MRQDILNEASNIERLLHKEKDAECPSEQAIDDEYPLDNNNLSGNEEIVQMDGDTGKDDIKESPVHTECAGW